MRKVLSFVLVLSLILGSFSFAFGANATTTYSDTVGTKSEGAVAVLAALGVVNGYPDGTYRPENVVKRSEMAKLIVVALGLEDYVKGMYSSFPDAKGHWAENYIAYATSLGIIEGYPDGTFRPDVTVTYQQAATMLVRALGYQDQYLTGVWPASHVNQAMKLGILDDIVATAEGANRGDIALMLYNTLNCLMITYDSLGNESEKADTMLNRLGARVVQDVIDHQLVYDAAIDIDEYYGAYAKFWVIDDDDDDLYDVIIVVEEEKSTTLTGELNKQNEFTVGDKAYTLKDRAKTDANSEDNKIPEHKLAANTIYDDEGKLITKETTRDAYGYYNGITEDQEWVASTDDKTQKYTISAKVSGNYITDIYSYTKWEANAEVQWDSDYKDTLADDQMIDDYKFELTDDDEIDSKYFILAGVDSLDAISDDDVVTVYAAKEAAKSKITKVEVGTEAVDGKISRVNKDGDEFTIDGKVYELSDNYGDSDLKVGDTGTFYLNYKGEIAFFDKDDDTGNYAMVVKGSGGGGDYEDVKVKLLTKDGKETVFNGKKDEYVEGLEADTLITYKTNADGKISAEPKKYTVDNGKATAATGSLSSKGVLNGKLLTNDAVVFINDVDDDGWYVGSVKDVDTDAKLDGNAYYVVNSDGKIDCLVITKAEGIVDTNKTLGYINDWYSTQDSDDNDCYSVSMLANGVLKEYLTDGELDIKKLDNTEVSFNDYKDLLNETLFVFKFDGDMIDSIAVAKVVDSNTVAEDFATGEDAYRFLSGIEGHDAATIASFNAYKVVAKDGDRIDVGVAADKEVDPAVEANPDYQLIEGAHYYKMVLNKGKTAIKNLEVGKASDVKKGTMVVLLQLDDDSDNWDTVVYMTKADYDDYVDAIK